jgi:hypothetical protein
MRKVRALVETNPMLGHPVDRCAGLAGGQTMRLD